MSVCFIFCRYFLIVLCIPVWNLFLASCERTRRNLISEANLRGGGVNEWLDRQDNKKTGGWRDNSVLDG
jgi:hypothetical protein